MLGTHQLHPHPSTVFGGVECVCVDISSHDRDVLVLEYRVRATAPIIVAPAEPARTDGLWRSTCFELFLRNTSGNYVEFNFAPSRAWAAYAFDSYRAGMRNLLLPRDPQIALQRDDDIGLHVTVPCSLEDFQSMALTAILDHGHGRHSFWALRHPPGKPDFHHAEGFALTLPSPATD